MPRAVVVHWNGVDVPTELKALRRGRYVLVALDEPPELTEEQEAASPETACGPRAPVI